MTTALNENHRPGLPAPSDYAAHVERVLDQPRTWEPGQIPLFPHLIKWAVWGIKIMTGGAFLAALSYKAYHALFS